MVSQFSHFSDQTTEEQRLLASYEDQLQIVRDRTRGVAEGWHTGFYLHGDGGIGKSIAVNTELDRLGKPWHLTNTQTSAKGLFDLLAKRPDVTHVLEDMEDLLRDRAAAGVLRAALWSSGTDRAKQHQPRRITWNVSGKSREVIFTGGIIFSMNTPLSDLPIMKAVKTRIAHLHFAPTNAEIAMQMKTIARKGHQHGAAELTPMQCLDVYEFVMEITENRTLDIRLMMNGFGDRLQWEAGHSTIHWKEMIRSRLIESTTGPVTRSSTMAEERKVALEINALAMTGNEKLAEWNRRTGKSKDAYYRRLAA